MEMDDHICCLMKKGIIDLSLGKYENAISSFDEILSIDDYNFAALNNKGLSLNGLGKFNEAIGCFDSILNEDYEFIFSLMGKGESLYYLEIYDSAIDYFNRVLKLDSKNDVAIFYKAKCYTELKQYGQAKKCLDIVRRISGNLIVDKFFYNKILNNSKKELFDVRSHFIKKLINLRKAKDYDEYSELVDEALKFDRKSTFFLLNKSFSLYYLEKFGESLNYVENILKVDFMNIDALFMKSKIHVKLNQYELALEALDDILKLGGTVDEVWYENILKKVNDEERVYNNINSLILDGNDYASCGRYDVALNHYNAVLNVNPHNLVALNNKGFVLYLLNQYEESLICFDQVLDIKRNCLSSLLGKSYSLCCMDRFTEALFYYKLLLDIDQSNYDENYFGLLNNKIKN